MRHTLLFAVLLGLAVVPARAQRATVQEEEWVIPSYPFSDPNPVPILTSNPRIYPYPSFDGFTNRSEKKTWKIIRLENDYLRVYVLPEAGGKILGAVEKSTGREFIYQNDAMKFRRIALRGPWTSGGIEFNFGIIGHTPTTATPVNYHLSANQDGSATCYVGTMDLPSRTRWTVAITVPAEGAYIENRVVWTNPTPWDQSSYSWITAAVSARPDLEYFYPGTSWVPHSNSIDLAPWPVDTQGRNLAFYRNNNFEGSKSYFVVGAYNNFFGGYWHDLDFGFGHWALYDDVPGKKIWIWSLFRDGGIWENLLTDARGQYTEPQAGRLFSQVDHEFLAPRTADTWREIWFPVKEIGGLAAASPWGAMNVTESGDSVFVAMCALQRLKDTLTVRAGEKILWRGPVSLAPMEVARWGVSRAGKGGALRVDVGRKLSYDSAPEKLERPIQYKRPPEDTPEGLYLAGEFHEKQREYDTALARYLACIKRDPQHLRALVRTAGLYGRRGEYVRGIQHAAQALRLDMYNPEANYVYGVLARATGRLVDAQECFGWAARSPAFRSNAYSQMAEIHMQERRYELAVEYAHRAVEFNGYNLRGREILASALRRLGRTGEARQVLGEILERDPLDMTARFELYLLEPREKDNRRFRSLITCEIPHETFLEIALWEASMGFTQDALTALSLAPSHPIVHAWCAYLLRETDPGESQRHLGKFSELPANFVFPFREESIPVLEWIVSRPGSDWKSRYYLALLYWGKGRKEEARGLLAECGSPEFSPLLLARAHLNREGDTSRVLPDLRKAVEVEPKSWRAWHALTEEESRRGNPEVALHVAQEAVRRAPAEVVIFMDLAGCLYAAGRYGECLSLLDTLIVLPYEGSWEAHDLFVRGNIQMAFENMKKAGYEEALEYLERSSSFPEHLGTGEPWEPDHRLQDKLSAVCYTKTRRQDRAREMNEKIVRYTLTHGLSWGTDHEIGIRTLNQMGETAKADILLKAWEATGPTDPASRWALARLRGRNTDAAEAARQGERDPRFRLRLQAAALAE